MESQSHSDVSEVTSSYSTSSASASSSSSSSSSPSSSHGDEQQSDKMSSGILSRSDNSQSPSSFTNCDISSPISHSPSENTVAGLSTTTQHPHLATINEQCGEDDNNRDKDVVPVSTLKEESPPAGHLPVSDTIHFAIEEVDDSNQAIINLHKQIEEYNLGLRERNGHKNDNDSSLVQLQSEAVLDNTADVNGGTAVTSSTSGPIVCSSNRRSYKSEPVDLFEATITTVCDGDESFGGLRDEINIQDVDTIGDGDEEIGVGSSNKGNRCKAVKRLDISRSVSKQSAGSLSFFKRKFQSLTFKRKGSTFLTLHNKSNAHFTNQIKGSYKKTSAQAIVAAIQLGIAYSVGKFSAKPDRDVLLQDFFQVEEVYFPSCGTTFTPSHRFADFTMSDYSPVAFRYFRDIFSIGPEDFMTSLSTRPLRQLSNPGASGSMFFVSEDDTFIIKTVDKREAKFLQQLLPGYYMNLHQNPKTLLPKFFGLYSYKYSGRNIRLVVMNNLMPSRLQFHEKYDLKGSTFKRKASQKERGKLLPTLKDLDFLEKHPDGFQLSHENYQRLFKTLQRDTRVLQSYKIMDYSLLLCVHNKVIYEKNKLEHYRKIQANLTKSTDITIDAQSGPTSNAIDEENATQSNNASGLPFNDESTDNSFDIDEFLKNGIPAQNSLGEDLILFVGIIDILQNYRLIKRTEHNLKAMVHDRDSISVHNPVYYAQRFLSFCSNIFKVSNKPTSNGNALTRKSTSKSPQQKNAHTVSSTSQPIISMNNPDTSNKPVDHRNRNVNKFVDNI